jgi:hypothetical protein
VDDTVTAPLCSTSTSTSTDSYHHADHGDHNHHCDDDCDSDQPLVPGGLVHYGLARRGRPVRGLTVRPRPVRSVCDHQASGLDSFDDLCDDWEGKALHRLVWRFSSAASKGHRYGSQRHVRLTLRDTLCGPKLCGPKLR